jgi:hypothetical protein
VTTTASVIDVISVAQLISPTSTLTVTPASAGGATDFSGLTGTWSLAQVDGTGSTNTFLRADKTWATVTFSVLGGALAMSQIPAGGSSSTFLRGDGVYAAVPVSTPTVTKNTSGGTVAISQTALRLVVHASATATSYQFPASPTDGDVIDFVRDSTGAGTIALDGGSINIVRGATSALTWGPSSKLNAIRATYFSTGNVWRLS